MHIAFNMLLYMFGGAMERVRAAPLSTYYLVCVVSRRSRSSDRGDQRRGHPTVGASGRLRPAAGIRHLLPHSRIILISRHADARARFCRRHAVMELFLGVTGRRKASRFAHLGGLIGGFIMLRYWRSAPSGWRQYIVGRRLTPRRRYDAPVGRLRRSLLIYLQRLFEIATVAAHRGRWVRIPVRFRCANPPWPVARRHGVACMMPAMSRRLANASRETAVVFRTPPAAEPS